MEANKQTSTIPLWVRILFLFSCGGAVIAALGLVARNDAVKVVEAQLQSLTNHSISEAYYEYTAKEFQKTTTLPQFREFLSIYPVLYDTRTFRLELSSQENNRAHVTGVLVSGGLDEMKAEWGLVNEDGEWKVVSLRLTELQTDDEGSRITSQMINFVKNQLQALRKQDFVEAYYGYVSKDFQKETSISDFEAFIEENPILLNYRTIDSEDGRVEKNRGYVTLALENEKGSYLLEYTLSRELGDWKVFGLKVVMPPEIAIQKAATNPEALVPPVKDLLEALANEQFSRAYNQTSKGFQDSTSFENFRQFIQLHPAFSVRELADIKRGEIENGTGKVRVNLHDDDGITVVDFRMAFTEGVWFIWGVEVIESPVKREESHNTIVEKEDSSLADRLMAILQQQMTYLYHQDIYEAYALMMSKNYRSKNTMDDFEAFFASHPMFLDHRTSYFNRIHDQGEHVTLRGFLTTFDEGFFPVRFDFTKKDGEWKIDDMSLLEKHEPIAEAEHVLDGPEGDFPPEPLEFVDVVLGTEVDNKGFVIKPLELLGKENETDQLFFNVHLINGQPEISVTLLLEHVDSGSTAPSLSTVLEKEGKSVILFSYASPKDGWPPGEYIVKVKSSTGPEYISKFKLELQKL